MSLYTRRSRCASIVAANFMCLCERDRWRLAHFHTCCHLISHLISHFRCHLRWPSMRAIKTCPERHFSRPLSPRNAFGVAQVGPAKKSALDGVYRAHMLSPSIVTSTGPARAIKTHPERHFFSSLSPRNAFGVG